MVDIATKVRVNITLTNEPARILLELKRRGLVTSNRDGVIQALLALYEKIIERDLALARLRTLEEARGEQ